jgi:hypothetical protein
MRILQQQPNSIRKLQSFLEQKERELENDYIAQHKEVLAETFDEDILEAGGFAIYWELLTMDIANEWEDIMFITGQIAAFRQIQHLLEE